MKKMLLVPPDMVTKHRIENIEHPERKAKEDVDSQMNDLLHDSSISDRDKVLLYSQLLHKLVKKPIPEIPKTTLSPPPSPTEDPWITMTMNSIPSTFKRNSKALFDYFKHTNAVQWKADGSLIIGDQDYPGTNIMDIVSYASRERKNIPRPNGTDVLVDYLKANNAPREIIGNTQLWRTPQAARLPPTLPPPVVDTPPKTPIRPRHIKKIVEWRD